MRSGTAALTNSTGTSDVSRPDGNSLITDKYWRRANSALLPGLHRLSVAIMPNVIGTMEEGNQVSLTIRSTVVEPAHFRGLESRLGLRTPGTLFPRGKT